MENLATQPNSDKDVDIEMEMDFGAVLDDYLDSDFGNVQVGNIVTGEVVKVDDNYVLVDVNFKSEGQLPISEFKDGDKNCTVKVGDKVDVFVVSKKDSTGTIILSHQKAKRMQFLNELEDILENKKTITGRIVRRIKGGYIVDINGMEAFLPGSHVDLRPVPDMDALVDQSFEFRVLKINRQRSNIIVSRRVLLEEARDSKRSALLDVLEEGQLIKGVVKNITDYGAFIDLGGLDGLLHITDMSWKRIKHPKELVQLGDELELKVLKFDQEKQKVSLGLKQLIPDPWENISGKYPEGTKCAGKVTNLVDYGA
ncbi:MAG: S1 RNA-binding domain-containing protein, partial [Desulfoplanes sp.]|nr:S1 RNA-binding domain-containing protein [Desulfoplanes sp.]